MRRITDLTAIDASQLQENYLMEVVDIVDLTMSETGTNKKVTTGELANHLAKNITDSLVVDVENTDYAVKITQRGTGSTVLIYDEANDSSPVVVDEQGNVGVGLYSPDAKLHVDGSLKVTGLTSAIIADSAFDALRITQTGEGNALVVEDENNPDNTPFIINKDGNIGIGNGILNAKVNIRNTDINDALFITQGGNGRALVVEDSDNDDNTPFVIDNVGNVVVGFSNALTNDNSKLQVVGPANFYKFEGTGGSSVQSTLNLTRSKSEVVNSHGLLSINDDIGTVRFRSSDGTKYITSASISSDIDQTTGTNNVPGRLVFSTTGAGATSTSERMRIDSAGNVGIGTSSPVSARVHIYNDNDNTALRVTQSGLGNSFVVEDASGDGTPFIIDSIGRVAIGTSDTAAAKLRVAGNIISDDNIAIRASTTESRSLEIGSGRTGNGSSYVDLITDSINTNYGSRLVRYAGENANTALIHKGTGNLELTATGLANFLVKTSNTTRAQIDPSGKIAINTNTFDARVNVRNSDSSDAVRITQTGTGHALVVEDSNISEPTPFVIDKDGRVLVGLRTPRSLFFGGDTAPKLQVEQLGGSGEGGHVSITRTSKDANASHLIFGKNRGTTVGSHDAVIDGDRIGRITFQGANGTSFLNAAAIISSVDGIPTSTNIPGRITFHTIAAGGDSSVNMGSVERMRIDNAGNVGIGKTAASAFKLDVNGQVNATGLTLNVTRDRVLLSNNDGKVVASSKITTIELDQLDGIRTASTIQDQIDTKELILTGAATSIAHTNLQLNRVAISNEYGKIAASDKITIQELEQLDGISTASTIQAQLNSKQPNITGAATYIANNDLDANRVAISNAAGKVRASTITTVELDQLDGIRTASTIQDQIDSKQPNITGAATYIANNDLDANRVAISNAAGKVRASGITTVELEQLDGISTASTIQAQLNSKQPNITGAATYIANNNLIANRVAISNADGKVRESGITTVELNYLDNVTSNIQTQLNSKQPNITGAASTITDTDFERNRVMTTNNSGKADYSSITTTELGYLDNVTSNIQTQLNSKQPNITGAASTITDTILERNRVMTTNNAGRADYSSITTTELDCLDNVTSNIQTQLNSKEPNINLTSGRVVISNSSGKLGVSGITSDELNSLNNVTGNIQAQLNNKFTISRFNPNGTLKTRQEGSILNENRAYARGNNAFVSVSLTGLGASGFIKNWAGEYEVQFEVYLYGPAGDLHLVSLETIKTADENILDDMLAGQLDLGPVINSRFNQAQVRIRDAYFGRVSSPITINFLGTGSAVNTRDF